MSSSKSHMLLDHIDAQPALSKTAGDVHVELTDKLTKCGAALGDKLTKVVEAMTELEAKVSRKFK